MGRKKKAPNEEEKKMSECMTLSTALRHDAVQMEEHAVTFDIVKVIADCRSADDAIEKLQTEHEQYKACVDNIIQLNSRLQAENERLKAGCGGGGG